MDLIDFRNHVLAQREASKKEALSVLSATIQTNNERKEN